MNNTRLAKLLLILVLLFGIYKIVFSIYISQTTGILKISSTSSSAYLTVTQPNKNSVNVGTGSSKVHLAPGTYTIYASSGLNQAKKTVTVQKKVTDSVFLNLDSSNTATIVQNSYIQADNIINQLLPFTGPNFEYQITYSYSYSKSVAIPLIIITAPDSAGQQAAVSFLQGQGYDVSKLPISYVTGQP